MMEDIKRFAKSLSCALNGFLYVIKKERNFQIEIILGIAVLILIKIFEVKSWEAVVLIVMIAAVLVMELANTVIERVADILKPKIHPYAKLIKDIMAAAVLISSLAAVAVGIIIFLPYFSELFNGLK
ncbi:MAG: diacylglycerol kinase [uncultured bacterium]|nr:MAG: diacylglycerol kinase [uncultured bacterium]HBR72008.1 diacylglycerol kinase [Candidatus Moranbacteria bacterium]